MRVTTRRLQASLDLLQFGKHKKVIRKLKKRLRGWRRKLSKIRNYDVFLIFLEGEAEKQNAVRKSVAALTVELQGRRDHLCVKTLANLKKVDINEIANALGLKVSVEVLNETGAKAETVNNGPSEIDEQPESKSEPLPSLEPFASDHAIARRAAKRIDQRLAEFVALAAEAKPTTHPEELHRLRIAAKRLRYLLEIAGETGYGRSKTALDWLRSLQDRIGEWHDLESLEDEILDIIANREFIKERMPETAVILAATIHLQKRRKALVSRLFPVKTHPRVVSAARRISKAYRRDASTKS